MKPQASWLVIALVAIVSAAVGFGAGIQYRGALNPAPEAIKPKVALERAPFPPPATPAPSPATPAKPPVAEPAAAPPASPPAVEPQPPPQPDPWSVSEDRSDIDDSPRVTLISYSEERYNRYSQLSRPALVIRCLEHSTDLYIVTDEYLGMDTTSVTTRMDDDKAMTSSWNISTDNKGMFARDAIGMAKRLMTKQTLTVRFTPYSENPVTLKFDVSQLDKHLPKVAKACGWKL